MGSDQKLAGELVSQSMRGLKDDNYYEFYEEWWYLIAINFQCRGSQKISYELWSSLDTHAVDNKDDNKDLLLDSPCPDQLIVLIKMKHEGDDSQKQFVLLDNQWTELSQSLTFAGN